MSASMFKPMVAGWSGSIEWNKGDLRKATALLSKISAANAGDIAPDMELDAEAVSDFAFRRVEDALTRRVIPYARALRKKLIRPRYMAPLDTPVVRMLPGLVAHEWKNCVDLNCDDADALCGLPGINRGSALRIIEYRRTNGGFTEPEQLTNATKIRADAMRALKPRAFCGVLGLTAPVSNEIISFLHRPTFGSYVRMIAESKGVRDLHAGASEDPRAQILSELEGALQDVLGNKHGIARNLDCTRASSIMTECRRREAAAKIGENGVSQVGCGALLYDGQYLPFLRELLAQAKKSINIMMFFMKYEEGTDYIVNSLVKCLVEAHRRGADVKVILDRDGEDDAARSRLINEPAFQMLRKNGVSVLYDTEDRMTHSKLVVVDGTHVVVGSHNWTGGSSWAYDDTSIYVESEELARQYHAIFDALWGEYGAVEKKHDA